MKVSPKVVRFGRSSSMNLLSRVGVFPTRSTPRDEVNALLRELHPRVADAPLIRLGPSGDGGYLVPDDLDGLQACFSPGVDRVSGFELSCAERGMSVFMADGSVDHPAETHDSFTFVRKFLGAVNSPTVTTMDSWVAESLPGSTADLLLQMDIEGSEYEVILNTSEDVLRRFRIIVAEFHGLERLFSAPCFSFMSAAFRRLLDTHRCVHIHPNNCGGSVTVGGVELPQFAEFTFVRNDRVSGEEFARDFPHPLDVDCTDEAHLALSKSLYRSGY